MMIDVLEKLSLLKSDFNLNIKLDQYLNNDLEKTALHLLQRVQIGKMPKLLTDHISPLFLKHNKTPDLAMIEYIQFLVMNRKFMSLWQEKAVTVIQMLRNEDDKLKCALLVLNEAPVPWIDELKPLEEYGRSSHPLADEIRSKHQLQVVNMIKVKYNFPIDCDTDNSMQLINRIVKLATSSMVDEIKAMAKVMPVQVNRIYLTCIPQFIKTDQLEVALTLFDDFKEKGSVHTLIGYFSVST